MDILGGRGEGSYAASHSMLLCRSIASLCKATCPASDCLLAMFGAGWTPTLIIILCKVKVLIWTSRSGIIDLIIELV